jgi:hypothetical protein
MDRSYRPLLFFFDELRYQHPTVRVSSGVEGVPLRTLAAEIGLAVVLRVLKFSETVEATRSAPAISFNTYGLGPPLPPPPLPPPPIVTVATLLDADKLPAASNALTKYW